MTSSEPSVCSRLTRSWVLLWAGFFCTAANASCEATEPSATAQTGPASPTPASPSKASCDLIELAQLTRRHAKASPETELWVNLSGSAVNADLSSVSVSRNWVSLAQAQNMIDLNKQSQQVIVLLGSGIDDPSLARRCAESLPTGKAVVLRGGSAGLFGGTQSVSAHSALSVLLNSPSEVRSVSFNESARQVPVAQPHDQSLLAKLIALQVATQSVSDQSASIELVPQKGGFKHPLIFTIDGGSAALNNAFSQISAFANLSKTEPKRPCYFPQ